MIGMCLVCSWLFNSLESSIPSIWGMRISEMMRAGECSVAFESASWPWEAVITSKLCLRKL